ncbi:uncharacterized protein TRAVEDRAFT_51237 [Trametes versicolor FP-101664 SS1]|uniref:uncharacterized protein n=1 Tax=Trametes versicolor (strain FP-101664) TaxID=717944 RepID=UPI0004624449|nr:uncharacterized protein TRAVEDRAFT_51237 [Trametes versicolor FP-101664 SS1]EIW55111.1 hypothetical protein TRAVEDRAFT_51237 [Trametes versicolor FP-101664 SS1]
MPVLIAQRNGFVHSILEAYGAHHHLVIRPDDVWIAILTQLSFYVNAHAGELRNYFVAHEGKRRLTVYDVGTRHTVDFGRLARAMTQQIHKNVVDSTLVEWILPDFTTTSLKDTTICSVIMMSTLKAYFDFRVCITCGIPSVTLEGTKADWQRILKRLERLHDLGDEPSTWATMLYPILSRFVSAFDGNPDTEFWKHMVYRSSRGCGTDSLDGWLTAFCVWTKKGQWKARPLAPLLATPRPPPFVVDSGWFSGSGDRASLYEQGDSTESASVDGSTSSQSILTFDPWHGASYTLDGVPYFTVDIESIPAGCCEVDVMVDDNGQQIPCTMIAGHVASVATAKDPGGPLDTLAPAPQWFMMEKKSS